MLYVGACYGVCFLLSDSHVAAMLTSGGSSVGVFNVAILWDILLVDIRMSW